MGKSMKKFASFWTVILLSGSVACVPLAATATSPPATGISSSTVNNQPSTVPLYDAYVQ
jgi:hypothetical protein